MVLLLKSLKTFLFSFLKTSRDARHGKKINHIYVKYLMRLTKITSRSGDKNLKELNKEWPPIRTERVGAISSSRHVQNFFCSDKPKICRFLL